MTGLTRVLKVRPGEGRVVALLVGVMFLTSAGGSIGGNGIDALFFSRFGVRFLPHMYIALAAVTLVTSLGVTVLLARVAHDRLFLALSLVIAGALLLERALVELDLPFVYPVLWLGMNVKGALQALLTWGLAGLACDTRQAKRLFPLFGAGGILGAVAGGLGTPALVGVLHTENLLLVWAAALAGTFALGIRLPRGGGDRKSRRRRRAGSLREMQDGYRTVVRSPFLLWMSGAVALFAVLLYSIAFPFSKAVAARFPDEDALAGFLGLFQGGATGVALLVSLLVANRLFARFGVMRMLVAFPVIYLAGFGS